MFLPFILSILIMLSLVNGFVSKSLLPKGNFLRFSGSLASGMAEAPYSSSERLNLRVDAITTKKYSGDILLIPFYKPSNRSTSARLTPAETQEELKKAIPSGLSPEIQKLVEDVISEGLFKADIKTMKTTRVAAPNMPKYISLLGLGPDRKAKDVQDIEVVTAQRIGKAIAGLSSKYNAKNIGVMLPNAISNSGVTQLILGLHEGSYKDNRFKKPVEKDPSAASSLFVQLLGCSDKVATDIQLTSSLTNMIADGVHFARDLVGAPPNCKTPVVIAEQARKIASECNLQCTILGAEECKIAGMGGYLGVQQGSKFPPQFIHLKYSSVQSSPSNDGTRPLRVALVGKGLTMDTGGYNLKVGAGSQIEYMKYDMGGCAAVLGAAMAIGKIRPMNVEVHFITAVCENMISSEAMRPGDILTASNGKTIEVQNTDAEGRLTLADALVYAEKQGVDVVIDLATLTGAIVVGLGENIAGMYSSDDQLARDLETAAKRTDEPLWRMPLEDSYRESVKSKIADLKNVGGGKGAGSITAALFLQEFVDKAKWAHIDMAGPVWDSSATKPTGYGVKLLVDYLINAMKEQNQ